MTLELLENRLAPATFTWTGGGGPDGRWSNPANWGGMAPSGQPTVLDDLVFPTGVSSVNTVNDMFTTPTTPVSFNSITLSGSGYTLSGNAVILGNSAVSGSGYILVNSGASGETVSLDIQLAGATGNQQFITANAGAVVTLSGHVSGASTLTKEGTGQLILTGDNSGFTGQFAIDVGAGTVTMTSATALGRAGGSAVVGQNSSLQVRNVTGVINESLTLNGPGINNAGALLNVAGTNTWAGNITLGSDSTLGATADKLTITGQISDSGGGHNLTKEGPGEVFLEPLNVTAGNTYRGNTTVNGGTLTIGHPFALGVGGFRTTVTSTLTESGTLAINYVSNPQLLIAAQYLNTNASGTVVGFKVPNELLTLNGVGREGILATPRDMATRHVPTSPIVTTTGALDNQAGSNSWEQAIKFWTSNSTVILPGSFYEPAICIGAEANSTLTIDGVIQDPGITSNYSFSKVRGGRLILTTANVFTADVDILQGYLNIQDSNALGLGASLGKEAWWGTTLELQTHGVIDSSTGTYNLRLPALNYIWLNGPGVNNDGALRNISGVNKIVGRVSLQSSASIDVEPDPDPTNSGGQPWNDLSQLTIDGVVDSNGTNNLTKIGQGELVLTAANTYTGQTLVNQGWLSVRNNGALGPRIAGLGDTVQPRTTVASGAALVLKQDLNGQNITISRPLTLSGTGFTHRFPWLNHMGALENLGGTNTVTSDITFNGGAVGIGVELDGALTPPPASLLTFTGSLYESNGPSGITKLGSQMLIIQGNGTYTGPVDIQNGVLRIQNDTALGAGVSTTTVESGAAMEMQTTIPQLNGGITRGLAVWGERLVLNGTGNTTFGDLPLTIGSNIDEMWRGPISLTTSSLINVPQGARLIVFGVIDDTGNTAATGSDITVTGGGLLTLYGANTYRGVTHVNQGALTVANSQALGASATAQVQSLIFSGPGVTAGTTRFTLTFNGSAATAPITYTNTVADIAAIQTALQNLPTVNSVGGVVSVAAAPGGFSITFGGGLAGFSQVPGLGATIVAGPGNVAVNTTTIGTGGTIVASGASLQLQGGITVAGKPVVVQGQGLSQTPNVPLQWFNVGPAPILSGQTPGNGNVTGRVTGVAVDPSDPNVIYIATAGGGAWKTKDGGKSWLPLFDMQNNSILFGGAISVSSQDPRIIYYGTGEADGSADSYYGSGVYVSRDSGQTWTLLSGSTGIANPMNGKAVSKIVIDPSNSNRIYVASSDLATHGTLGGAGVWRFDGTSWFCLTNVVSTVRSNPPPTGGFPPAVTTPGPDDDFRLSFASFNVAYSDLALTGGVLFMAMNASSPAASFSNAVYHCINPTTNTPIWRVGDGNPGAPPTYDQGGANPFPTNIGATPPAIRNGNMKITVTVTFPPPPALPITHIYVAITNPTTGALREIETSTDGGVTWAPTAGTPANYQGSQGNYDSTIIGTGSTLYVGGQNNVLRSTDGGATWTDISVAAGNGPHVDDHGMALDALGRVILGNDGGVWRWDNGAGSWTDINGNLAITTFNGIAQNPTDPTIAFGGSQDNGTERFGGSQAWTFVDNGDGGLVHVDPNNPNNVYHVLNGALYRSTTGGGLGSFTSILGVGGIYFPFLIDTVNSSRLLAGGTTVQESTDQGNTWSDLRSPIGVTALAAAGYQGTFAADPGFSAVSDQGANHYDSDTVYVTNSQRVYVTKDHGSHWVNRSTGLPTSFFIQDLEVDPRNRDTAYVVNSNGPNLNQGRVFVTTDAGRTWTNITNNLPDTPTWKLVLDPRDGTLYVGTDLGVYSSINGGTTWTQFGAGMPLVAVHDLELNQSLNILAAGTYGRSMYQFFLNNVPANSGVFRATSGTPEWTGPVKLAGNTWVAANGTQSVQNGFSLTQLTILGIISDLTAGGNYQLTKIGNGDVIFSGANTYGGLTEVQQGNLVVHNPQALGSPSQGTIVDSGAALELESSLNAEPIQLNGNGIAYNGHFTGALHNVSNNNTYTGILILNTNSTIGVDSGSQLTISGTGSITDGGNNYSLSKEGIGPLVLASANTYGGATLVNQGILNVQNAQALGSGTTAATGVTVLDGAQLQLQGNTDVQSKFLRISGTGITNDGALKNVAGANKWEGPIILAQDPGFSPTTNPPSSIAIGVLLAGATNALTLNGVIGQASGTLGLTKVGPGLLILDNNNTYQGPTLVATGILRIQTAGALGTSPNSATVNAGAALELDGDPTNTGASITVTGENLTISGAGIAPGNAGALRNISGNNTWTGTVTLLSDTAIGVDAGTQFTLVGTMGDVNPLPGLVGASITKSGTGTLFLPNANFYGGVTNINAGIVNIGNNNSLGVALSEVQAATVNGTTGPFSLTFNGQTTTQLAFNSTATQVHDALMLLTSIGGVGGTVNVVKSGGVYTVTFGGTLASQSLPLMSGSGSGGTTVTVTRVTAGGGGAVVVASGATLQLQGTGLNMTKALTLNGPGFNNAGALDNVSGNNTWAQAITLGSNASIGVDGAADTLVVNQTISDGGNNFGVTKFGAGTLDYAGGAGTSNTYTGLTQVNAGTLLLDKNGAAAVIGNLIIGTSGAPSALVRWMFGSQIPTTNTVVVNSSGTLDLGGNLQTFGTLTIVDGQATTGASGAGQLTTAALSMTGGTFTIATAGGALILTGNVAATSDASGTATITGSGGLYLNGATRTFLVAAGSRTIDLVVNPVIAGTGSAGLTKTGNGRLQLSAAEVYTGLTSITAGDVQVDGTIANVALTGGGLSGTGQVGTITGQSPTAAASGTVNPGDNGTATPFGILRTQAEIWGASTIFSVDVSDPTNNQTPTPGTNYDQLQVTGNLNLAGATLTGTATGAIPVGDQFTILQVTGGTLSGTFAQGSTVFLRGQKFSITYNYAAGTVVLTKAVADTTITVVSTVNPSAYGQSVVFVATVMGGLPPTTDTVSFTLDNNAAVNVNLDSNGRATFDPVAAFGVPLGVGTHTLGARFNGDPAFSPSSTTLSPNQTVGQASTRTLIAAGYTTPPVYGQAATFIATVQAVSPGGGIPAGTVQFVVDGQNQGTPVTLDQSGQAMLSISSLPAGTPHTIGAIYSGNTNYITSRTGTPLTAVVTPASTTTVVVPFGPSPTFAGQVATFFATIQPVSPGGGTPAGLVQFIVDGTPQPPVALNQFGMAGLYTSALSVGSHTIVVSYGGNTNYIASHSTVLGAAVNQASSTTIVFPFGPSPTTLGQLATFFTAIQPVSPGAGTPTGYIQFIVDNVAQAPVRLNQFGMAGLYTSSLASGPHTIVVSYGGDANFIASHSSVLNVAVVPGTTTSITPSSTPTVFGQLATFVATVQTVPPGGMLTGSVQLVVDGQPQGTPVMVDQSGQAVLSTSSMSAGTHAIGAIYSGDPNFGGSSVTTPISFTVNRASTSTAVAQVGQSPTLAGQLATIFTTIQAVSPGAGTPGGFVQFIIDGTPQPQVAVNQFGMAGLYTSGLSVGTHSIVVSYGGNANFLASHSSALSITVNQASSTTSVFANGPSPTTAGQLATFYALIQPVSPAAGTPTGYIQFIVDNVVQAPVRLNQFGMAGLYTSSLAAGQHSIVVSYGGDANFAASYGALPASQGMVLDAPPPTSLVARLTGPVAVGSLFGITAVANTAQGSQAFYNQPATLTLLSAPPGGTVSGSTSTSFVSGRATFSNLAVSTGGRYIVRIATGTLFVDLAFDAAGRQT
jgi:autotransporter-associated beta strand protein